MKNMKKVFALVLVVLLVVGSVPAVFAANETSIANNGWTAVSDADDFLAMTTGNYYLTNDIDFGGITVPYLVQSFNGNLEGNGYKLTGFTLSTAATGYAGKMGVFGELATAENTTVSNLTIGTAENHITASITNTSTSNGNNAFDTFGFLAGAAFAPAGAKVIVENVTVNGDVTTSGALGSSHRVAGILGTTYTHILMNNTFNGSINLNNTDTFYQYVGGIVAIGDVKNTYNQHAGSVIDGCVNNADITDTVYEAGTLSGILGRTNVGTTIINCVNNGDITAAANGTPFNKASAGVIGQKASGNLVIKSCVNTGTITSAYSAARTKDIHAGNLTSGRYGYVYVYGNKDANGNVVDDCAYKNFAANGSGKAETVVEITSEADLANVTVGGIYRLANDITLTKTYTNAVIMGYFNGIFDGNGKKIEGINITQAANGSGDVGFFQGIGHNNSVSAGGYSPVIIDLQLGSATNPGKISVLSSTTNGIGGLSGFMGHAADKIPSIVNCDVYLNFEYLNGTSQRKIGLITGTSRNSTIYGCNTYGSLTVSNTKGIYQNIGGIVGCNDTTNGLAIVNTNNFADISVSNTSSSANESNRAGGIIGGISVYNIILKNCANFGDIYSNSNLTNTLAGGIIGGTPGKNGTIKVQILDCTNFGKLESSNYVAGAIGFLDMTVVVSNFTNYGKMIGNKSPATTDNLVANVSAGTYPVINSYNCKAENFITVSDKASVRITAADPGLRFKAAISENAMDKLADILGDETVEYGMLIAANDTIGADPFIRENFTLKTEYIDVATPEWFDGQTGIIAASLTSIPATHYAKDACATAYADIKVGGTVVATIYANNANAVRNISQVADAALADVLYEKDGVFYTAELVEYTGADVADYKYATGEVVDGYNVYSCYSEGARGVLNGFAVAND